MIRVRAVQEKNIKNAMESRNMKHKHISQKPYCCVPACVLMIILRRKLPMIPQTDIAYDLGLILPLKDRRLLPKSYTGLKPKAGWGTRINLKRYSLGVFFQNRGYPLQEVFRSVNKFQSVSQFRKFLSDNIREKNDLLICFNYPLLYHIDGSWGHASLIESVYNEYAILRDPNPKFKKVRKVFLEDLLI